MSKFLNIALVLFLLSNIFVRGNTIEISGNVAEHNGSDLTITNFNYQKMASAKFKKGNYFQMHADIENGYYLLNYGRESSYIYLNDGDNLIVDFDAIDFENSLIFKGDGSERNNYLRDKATTFSELTKDVNAFYKVEESTYLQNVENVENVLLKLLESYKVEGFFVDLEQKSLEYEKLLSIQNYASSYKFYLGEEIELSNEFYESLDKVDLNNNEDYLSQPFYKYLVNSIWSKRISEGKNTEEMLNVLRDVKSEKVLISLVNGFYSKISSEKERGEDYFELIKLVAGNDRSFVDAAREKLKKTQAAMGLVEGKKSPSFSYLDNNGAKIGIEDFQGKYIYIDIWATWCAPCIKQIPYLKKLEERYHGKNISFVSISVDKEEAFDRWLRMIKVKELGGTQLFSDKSFNSTFMKAYGITSIPRFILIDPNGNIVDAEAPRPSFEKTITLLDGLVE
ncbi:TlpA disulfide reductase family protein [uncultured Maribacter sp.]|uniref:TlpA family protein disulfide reductase n=1 Tax=uncultured Maribacter sp. TaxID=431308 RepID=UPI002624B00B|nr:TlpA disulfide reductase family protein [uncultured Maribacter sp.]